MKRISCFGVILFLAAGLWAGQEAVRPDREGLMAPDAAGVEQKDETRSSPLTGTALLDLFIDNLSDMARQGTPDSLDKRLQEMMFAAKKARESNAIDAVFFQRFNRMLAVTKLVTVPDKSGILAPVIEDVLSGFVLDQLGHRGFREEGGKGPKSVNYVAQALSVELINLQIYLDTAKERASLQKKLDERMSSPKK